MSEDTDRCEAITTKGHRCRNDAVTWILVHGGVSAHVCHEHEDRRRGFVFDQRQQIAK